MRILLGVISGLVLSMSVVAQQGEIPADMEVIIFEHSRACCKTASNKDLKPTSVIWLDSLNNNWLGTTWPDIKIC